MNEIEYGMPALIELDTLLENAALCAELGLRFVELNMNLPYLGLDSLKPEALLALREKYGIYFTLHLEETLNPFDFNSRVAAAYRETAYDALRLARAIGAPTVNMHLVPGIYFTLPSGKLYLFDRYRERVLSDVRQFRDACGALLSGSDTLLLIENCGGFAPYQKEAIEAFLACPSFGLTLDIGHSRTAGFCDEPFIRSHADRLHHMHVHDATAAHNHLALGTGELDLPKYLALAAAHRCRAVLETKTVEALRQSVAWLKEKREGKEPVISL